jgi:hypothetical protein
VSAGFPATADDCCCDTQCAGDATCPAGFPYCCDGVCQADPCGCTGQCEWMVEWGLNNTFGWVLESGCEEGCVCPEPDADPGTEESPAQEGNYYTECVQCRDDDDCESGHCCDGVCQETPCADETSPCDCFEAWPGSVNLDITGLEDYFLPGEGRCNCPADGYAAGFNQTVVLDYAGEITYDGCPDLPGTFLRARLYAFNSSVFVGQSPEDTQGVAVYRGSMTNGECDEYGVEVLLFRSGEVCEAVGVIDKLAAGSPTICEPWVLASLTCNWWVMSIGLIDSECEGLELLLTSSYFAGGGGEGGTTPVATGTFGP